MVKGTACSALAGLYGALTVQGLPPSALKDQRIVVVGAGSAGMGVTAMVAKGMVKHGMSAEQVRGSRMLSLDQWSGAGSIEDSARKAHASSVLTSELTTASSLIR